MSETKLFKIFYDRMYDICQTACSDNEVADIKVWRDYIHGLGMEFVDSRDDDNFCVRDPLRQQMRYISMSKEMALKIIVLGTLP